MVVDINECDVFDISSEYMRCCDIDIHHFLFLQPTSFEFKRLYFILWLRYVYVYGQSQKNKKQQRILFERKGRPDLMEPSGFLCICACFTILQFCFCFFFSSNNVNKYVTLYKMNLFMSGKWIIASPRITLYDTFGFI